MTAENPSELYKSMMCLLVILVPTAWLTDTCISYGWKLQLSNLVTPSPDSQTFVPKSSEAGLLSRGFPVQVF